MRPGLITILFILLLDSCVDPMDVPVLGNHNVLVVDGLLTDQQAAHTVKLFYTSSLADNAAQPVPVTGATVSIEDDEGNIEELIEAEGGYYTTSPAFNGTVGRTYQLSITTTDGLRYESIPSQMRAPGAIDHAGHEFRENVINDGDLTKPQDALYFEVDGTASPGSNLLRWRWKATYYVETYPELVTRVEDGNRVPAPLKCSGYIAENNELVYQEPCTCCDCWPVIHGESVTVSDPLHKNQITFTNQFLGRVPLRSEYFYDKMVVEVDQMSISPEVHAFWSLVKTQLEGAGSIFQPNIVQVRGNMKCIDRPEKKVFGIFAVSAIVSTRHTIRLDDIPKRIPWPDSLTADCRTQFKASNQRPSFW